MSKTLTQARVNLARAAELRGELRQIDAAAAKANRDYTAAEKAQIAAYAAEIADCDQRAQDGLALQERNAGAADAMAPYAGVLPDTGHGGTTTRSIGALAPIDFSEEQLRSLHGDLMGGKPGQAALETRAVSAYPMAQIPVYNRNPVTFLRERTRLAQLMPTQQVDSASVTHYTTSTAASAADTVEPGATKPESTPGWTAVPTPIRKIAHFVDVPKEALDDFANFVDVIRTEMVGGLYGAENAQIISGSGVSPDITGLLTTAGISVYTAPAGSEEAYLSLRKAITMMEEDFISPDVVILHPADAEKFDLANHSADGLHATPDLTAGAARNVWGIPRIVTTSVASGTAIVANLAESTVLYMREPATIFVDPYSQSSANLVRFICEERIGLGVTRPTGILRVTFDFTP